MSFSKCISWCLEAGRLIIYFLGLKHARNFGYKTKIRHRFLDISYSFSAVYGLASWSILAFLNHDVRCNFLS